MGQSWLIPYWIVPPEEWGPLGFGVTAWSLADALTIIRAYGYQLPEDASDLGVIENVRYGDLDRHVQCNMGPIPVRGMWFPFVKVGPPPRL